MAEAMSKRHTHISKFLSFVLRHRPDEIGIRLDPNGWVAISELLTACAAHGERISHEELDYVVANNNKRRFAISEDGSRIRASQGHSVEVDLGYEPAAPPELLYHGTARQFVDAILSKGLIKGSRHHVHLSIDESTARAVGSRRGAPIILTVQAGAMARAGHAFYISANGVWLTDHVPPEFLTR
jgi:putative RNA 2'-phosphotransferase